MWRAIAAAVSFVVAAAVGVVTALVTAHGSAGLWSALGVLVVVGAVLQAVMIGRERASGRVAAFGAGAVAVGGSAAEIRTRVRGHAGSPGQAGEQDVAAAGAGAVAVGGEAAGPISTDVSSSDG